MNELFDFAFSPPVIGYTIFLMVFLLYWLTVIIGIFDFSSLDFDIDIDADIDMDVDVDVDVDADTDIDASGGGSLVLAILGFFNFGKVPFMVVMSIVALSLWTIAVLMNYYFSNGSIWFSIFLLMPNLFVSLLIAKIVTTPLVPLFREINSKGEPIDYIGLLGEISLETSSIKTGQMELIHNESFIKIMVKPVEEYEGTIKKGTEVVIAYQDESKELFFVRPTTF